MQDDLTHWRDSGRSPKFFIIEAQVFFPILLSLFHFRVWTLTLAVGMGILLLVLRYYNVTLKVFLLNLREWIFGREKTVELHESE
ncbi:IcmT/TraK family protein [Fangia hongkongensis]|uniref:IcmT/TraK family protein n=1 Tax=Fangia hongkongensis TaxID=270495 RepID=UPI00036345A7|nr:IcmT/TraK family protein [Fangia hongkongensis]MBK2124407.1 hypothetical protein [Fangia hongkongensis]